MHVDKRRETCYILGMTDLEKKRAYRRAHYAANKDAAREYYRANRDALLRKAKAYRDANKETLLVEGRARNKAYREKNLAMVKGKIKARRVAQREKTLLNNSRASAMYGGLAHDIGLEDIIIPEVCPVLGIKLDSYAGYRAPGLPSLDRVDSSKGYVKGNVRVISWRANRLKRELSMGEALAIYEYIRDHHESSVDGK